MKLIFSGVSLINSNQNTYAYFININSTAAKKQKFANGTDDSDDTRLSCHINTDTYTNFV